MEHLNLDRLEQDISIMKNLAPTVRFFAYIRSNGYYYAYKITNIEDAIHYDNDLTICFVDSETMELVSKSWIIAWFLQVAGKEFSHNE